MNRVLTAILLAPAVLAVVYFAPEFFPIFVLLLVALALLAQREFYDLAATAGLAPFRRFGFASAAGLIMALNLWGAGNSDRTLAAVCAVALFAILADTLAKPGQIATGLANAGVTLLGVFYPGFLIALLGLTLRDFGPLWVIWLLLIVWAGDVAALYMGRQWGVAKLAPQFSPNKTRLGAVAGLVAAVAVGLGVGIPLGAEAGFPPGLRWLALGGLAVAVEIAAQVGDLVESAFKRSAQVKDSGTLLPGHGGVLDRIDAMLLATPVLWLYLTMLHGARG